LYAIVYSGVGPRQWLVNLALLKYMDTTHLNVPRYVYTLTQMYCGTRALLLASAECVTYFGSMETIQPRPSSTNAHSAHKGCPLLQARVLRSGGSVSARLQTDSACWPRRGDWEGPRHRLAGRRASTRSALSPAEAATMRVVLSVLKQRRGGGRVPPQAPSKALCCKRV
jgi:hypothetical protein